LNANFNLDTLTDFATGTDKMHLHQSVFSALPVAALAANALVLGTSASTTDHRIIYDKATGSLYYDADGSGAGAMVKFAVLTNTGNLSANDFVVV
jgi:serralysin